MTEAAEDAVVVAAAAEEAPGAAEGSEERERKNIYFNTPSPALPI